MLAVHVYWKKWERIGGRQDARAMYIDRLCKILVLYLCHSNSSGWEVEQYDWGRGESVEGIRMLLE
jgi:hypothetical protein